MGWEKRGNSRYYYTKMRLGNRVVSHYVGSGKVARLISRLEEIMQERDDLTRWMEMQQREELLAGEEELVEAEMLVDNVVKAALVASGWHTHKGEWRRKRG
jgi:hypothetical protein